MIVRAALAVLVPLLCASAAVAQSPAPGVSAQAAATATPVPAGVAGKRTREGRRARRVAVADRRPARATGTIEEALTSCLGMWEPATHMTKAQWARACRRVAERLNDA
jgi:hypothetical protein